MFLFVRKKQVVIETNVEAQQKLNSSHDKIPGLHIMLHSQKSQNHKPVRDGKHLWRSSCPTLPAKVGPPRVSDTGTGGF